MEETWLQWILRLLATWGLVAWEWIVWFLGLIPVWGWILIIVITILIILFGNWILRVLAPPGCGLVKQWPGRDICQGTCPPGTGSCLPSAWGPYGIWPFNKWLAPQPTACACALTPAPIPPGLPGGAAAGGSGGSGSGTGGSGGSTGGP